MRVCMGLWGFCLILLCLSLILFKLTLVGVFGDNFTTIPITDGIDLIIAVLLLLLMLSLGGWGIYLLYVVFFRSDAAIDKTMNSLSDGGDFLGLILVVAVMLVALPLTKLFRSIHSRA